MNAEQTLKAVLDHTEVLVRAVYRRGDKNLLPFGLLLDREDPIHGALEDGQVLIPTPTGFQPPIAKIEPTPAFIDQLVLWDTLPPLRRFHPVFVPDDSDISVTVVNACHLGMAAPVWGFVSEERTRADEEIVLMTADFHETSAGAVTVQASMRAFRALILGRDRAGKVETIELHGEHIDLPPAEGHA